MRRVVSIQTAIERATGLARPRTTAAHARQEVDRRGPFGLGRARLAHERVPVMDERLKHLANARVGGLRDARENGLRQFPLVLGSGRPAVNAARRGR